VPIKCPQRMKTSKIKHGRSRGGWRGWRGWRGFLCCAQMAVFLTRIDLRSTCNECPKNVQRMSKECPKNVQRMSKECPKNAQRMSKECQKNVKRMSKECQKNVQRKSKECQKKRTVQRTPNRHPQDTTYCVQFCPKFRPHTHGFRSRHAVDQDHRQTKGAGRRRVFVLLNGLAQPVLQRENIKGVLEYST
jgi:hypothetical protein